MLKNFKQFVLESVGSIESIDQIYKSYKGKDIKDIKDIDIEGLFKPFLTYIDLNKSNIVDPLILVDYVLNTANGLLSESFLKSKYNFDRTTTSIVDEILKIRDNIIKDIKFVNGGKFEDINHLPKLKLELKKISSMDDKFTRVKTYIIDFIIKTLVDAINKIPRNLNKFKVGNIVSYVKKDGGIARNPIVDISGDEVIIMTLDGKKVKKSVQDIKFYKESHDDMELAVGDEVIYLRLGKTEEDYDPNLPPDKQLKVVTKNVITRIEGNNIYFGEIKKSKYDILKINI